MTEELARSASPDAADPVEVPPSASAPAANRRAFGLGLFTLSAAAVAGGAAAPPTAIQATAAEERAEGEPAPPAPPPVPTLIDATEVELILEWVRRSDPDRLRPEHLAALRREVQANLARAAILHRYPLSNGDFPMPLPRFGVKRPPPPK